MIVFKCVYIYVCVWILLQDFEVKYGSSNKESFREVKKVFINGMYELGSLEFMLPIYLNFVD